MTETLDLIADLFQLFLKVSCADFERETLSAETSWSKNVLGYKNQENESPEKGQKDIWEGEKTFLSLKPEKNSE